ncbi:hypothetical protein [Aerosakkonema funiforme]
MKKDLIVGKNISSLSGIRKSLSQGDRIAYTLHPIVDIIHS